MTETYDFAVIGLGALGSAAAHQLASRGHSVVGLERFALGHDRGASHDTSRILRHSYHTPAYVRLTQEAYDDWAALEVAAGESFVTVLGIPHELLTVDQVAERWPQFALPEGTTSLFQARGAIVPAARGTAAMQRLAVAQGAMLRDSAPVTSVRDLGASVEVTAGGTTYACSGREPCRCGSGWTSRPSTDSPATASRRSRRPRTAAAHRWTPTTAASTRTTACRTGWPST